MENPDRMGWTPHLSRVPCPPGLPRSASGLGAERPVPYWRGAAGCQQSPVSLWSFLGNLPPGRFRTLQYHIARLHPSV